MRVLLFVQNEGDKRPRRLRCKVSRRRWSAGCFTGSSASGVPFHGFYVHKASRGAVARADRWWLVECENAEAGRALIALAEFDSPENVAAPKGRILASGGRA